MQEKKGRIHVMIAIYSRSAICDAFDKNRAVPLLVLCFGMAAFEID